MPNPPKMILCSASPARLATLRSAGVEPEVIVSGVDESGVTADSTAQLVERLAVLKAEAVHDQLDHDQLDHDQLDHDQPAGATRLLVGCDSLLDLDGIAYGKPHDPVSGRERWQLMRGRSGTLLTGHRLIVCAPGGDAADCRRVTAVGATVVHFADLSDAEIDGYVDTGEPLQVAGAFTVDGLGGPFVTGIEGDYHNVVGISLPLLRTMLAEAGIGWPTLWG